MNRFGNPFQILFALTAMSGVSRQDLGSVMANFGFRTAIRGSSAFAEDDTGAPSDVSASRRSGKHRGSGGRLTDDHQSTRACLRVIRMVGHLPSS
jgi:hypothetical protein